MPRIKNMVFLGDETGTKRSKRNRAVIIVVLFVLLTFFVGMLGGVGGILLLSNSNNKVKDFFGLNGQNSLSLNTTKTEKIIIEESSAITDSVKKVSPSVVSITTTINQQDIFSGQIVRSEAAGTGFIITSDGLIVTNKHVVESGDSYKIITSDGKSYDAKVLSKDPFNDLAVLKVDATGLPVVEIGSSADMKVGQWTIAIGNALGEFENTVTVGVISAKDRTIQTDTETLNSLLQTDAAINPGNSGGPLINLKGQVIGINTAVAAKNISEGIGFAIPIDLAKSAIDSVEKSGKIVRPYLGVNYLSITKDVAKKYNLSVDYGVLVARGNGIAVLPGSPADKAGIVENDIILQINRERIDDKNPLALLIQKYHPGDEVEVQLLRKGKEQIVKVKLEEYKGN